MSSGIKIRKKRKADRFVKILGSKGHWILFLVVFVFTVNGCGDGILGNKKDGKNTWKAKEVLFSMDNVGTLNPIATNDRDTYYISKLLYGGLYALDEKMIPVEDLAEKHTWYREDAAVEVELREAKWHDGTRLTAKDVIFSYRAHEKKGAEGQYYSIIKNIDFIEELDDDKVKIYFVDQDHMGLDLLTFPIVPKKQFDSVEQALEMDGDFIPIGTGPYEYLSYSKVGNLELKANEDYYGTVPENKLVFQVIPEKESAYRLVESSIISLLYSTDSERETQIKKEGVSFENTPRNQVIYLGFNVGKISDKKLRKALAYATDTQAIINESYLNNGIRTGSLYPPDYLGMDNTEDHYDYDEVKAKEQLESAGFLGQGEDGYLYNEKEQAWEVTLLVNEAFPERVRAGEMMVEEWEKIGIKAQLESYPAEDFQQRLKAGNFDCYIGSYTFDYTVDMRTILGDTPTNYTGYEKEELKENLNQLKSGVEVAQAKDLVEKIDMEIEKEIPYYPILYPLDGLIVSPTLKGTFQPLWYHPYNNCDQWYNEYDKEKEEKK